jgi:hypothetical protein
MRSPSPRRRLRHDRQHLVGNAVRRWFAGAILVTVGFLVTPNAVPIYDGVGSDEPYKYVGKSPAPVAVSLNAAVTSGRSGALQLRSDENGPQVLVDLAAGAFRATGTQITLSATPLRSDGTPPSGSFDGNVYRIAVTPGAVLQPAASQGYLFLRAGVMTRPDPVLVHRKSPTDPWATVTTTRAGRDILSTPLTALGDYVVVRLPGAEPLSSAGLSLVRVLLIGAGILVLLMITVLVLRRARTEGP